jgi:hypothetical protein
MPRRGQPKTRLQMTRPAAHHMPQAPGIKNSIAILTPNPGKSKHWRGFVRSAFRADTAFTS